MIRFIFIPILFASLSVGAQAFEAVANCSEIIGTCKYYRCVEKQESCGPKGYYTKFGLHYCEKYKADEHEYTERGKEFLHGVRNCLQDELERERIRSNALPRCAKVKKFAIATHKFCYQQQGFCNLPVSDRLRVKFTAKKELVDFQMFLFAVWLEKQCLF